MIFREDNSAQHYIKTMLKPVLNRKFMFACLADCPVPSAKATGTTTDNHARQLTRFLYGTL